MTAEELRDKQTEELARQQELQNRILCCTAAGCLSCGADGLRQALRAEVEAKGLGGKVEIGGTGCMGLCSRGPLVLDSAEQRLYGNVTAADAPAILSGNTAEQPSLAGRSLDLKSPFFTRQNRIVLANSGRVDPEKLADYIAAGGYYSCA